MSIECSSGPVEVVCIRAGSDIRAPFSQLLLPRSRTSRCFISCQAKQGLAALPARRSCPLSVFLSCIHETPFLQRHEHLATNNASSYRPATDRRDDTRHHHVGIYDLIWCSSAGLTKLTYPPSRDFHGDKASRPHALSRSTDVSY